jgi:hypothetical protein
VEKLKKSVIPLILLALLPASIIFINTPRTYAQTAELKITPAKNFFVANTTASGTKFTINITIDNVEDLYGWQISVTWNPAFLNYSDVTLPAGHVFAGKDYFILGPDISVPGKVVYGVTLGIGQTSFTGSGILCQIELEILNIGAPPASCKIEFADPYVDTVLLDSAGEDIEFTTVGAYFTYAYLQGHRVTVGGQNFVVLTYSNGVIAPNSVIALPEQTAILFNITGDPGFGFVNVTIPKTLLDASATAWKVYVDSTLKTAQITSNATHTFIYVEFTFGSLVTIKIVGTWIVPEFPSIQLLMLFMAIALFTVLFLKFRKHQK